MNPSATKSNDTGFDCMPEDSGVDLNRNWPIDWGQSEKTTTAVTQKDGTNVIDPCLDPCGECYKGEKPLSEPET